MKNLFDRTSIGNGVSFSSIHDPKFKHNRISVNMVMPLEEGKIAQRAIVPYILRQSCRAYPDLTLLNERLGDLYGASLEAFVDKFGSYQLLCLAVVGIDSRFAFENEDMVQELSDLLSSILLDPNFHDGCFTEQDTRLEKAYLKDTIESEINDKRSYAMMKCKSIMCEGEKLALRKYGTVEEVEEITPESATAAYKDILKHAQIEIVMTGSGCPKTALQVFERHFEGMERQPISVDPKTSRKLPVTKEKEVSEPMDVKQGKLVLGFRMELGKTALERSAQRMAIALLGGTPTSLLFMNVREKMSLCYYCQSRLDAVTGIMMIDSGVEPENAQKAREEILHQIKNLKSGAFEEKNITETKLIFKTAFRATGDSLSALENWYLTQILNGTSLAPEEELQLCETIEKDQIVAAANTIVLDTVYTLMPKEQ